MSDRGEKERGTAVTRSESERGLDYWQWDRWRWGTHRVNCYPGSCPFRVYVKDDKVVREEIACTYPPFEDVEHPVPDYNPRGCQKGFQHSKAMYGKDRVLHPMKRAGDRGSGKWEQVSWEQAFDEIGEKLAEIIEKDGPRAILDDHATNGVGVIRGAAEATAPAFAGILGGVSFDLNFLIGDFNPGQYLTFGQFQAVSGIENWFLADTVFVYSNPVYANIPDYHYFLEGRYRGAKMVVIAPDKNPTAQFGDYWVPINWSADPALWLGVCRLLIDRGWVDTDFMKEQTDLTALVRGDDGRYLRDSDLRDDGDLEQFFAVDEATGEIRPLPKDTLEAPFDYALEGASRVTLRDGQEVEVTTVFSLLKERVAEYTPEKVHEWAGVHPEMLETIAELCKPPRKVFVFANWNTGKLYHGDLVERSYCYMLALTGNIGKPGTGTRGWNAGFEFLSAMPMISGMPNEVLEAESPIAEGLGFLLKLIEDYRDRMKMDPTMPMVEAIYGAFREFLKMSGVLGPPAFFWTRHAGYKDVWDEQLDDPNAPRTISEYEEEALEQGWWEGFDRPAQEDTPKAMFVSGSNPLRRHRGRTYFETLWPKLDLVVVADTRWSTTGLWADYVLPAASYYEYADCKYSTPHTRYVTFTDRSVPMLGESKSDRMVVLGILRKVEEHLKKRGIDRYTVGDREIVTDEIYWRATLGGKYGDTDEEEERLVDHSYKALSQLGWLESLDGSSEVGLDDLREHGSASLSGRPVWPASAAVNSDMVPGEILYPFRDQVEEKTPYRTTTRRIQFLIDHPWFIEADEHLARYKEPPKIGGDHPVRLTGGHVRWSVHAVWHASEEMLKLHRGEPFAFINRAEADKKGIDDNDYIRVFNDYDDFLVRAKLSPCVRPDQLVIYHAWEPYQHPNWKSHDTLLPGPPKGLHYAGGYRHFEYTLWNWAPSQSDRQTNVSYEKAASLSLSRDA